MTDADRERAFLLAVCENPADDTPRLVFADWLEENGEGARAEFIRVQVESVNLGDVDRTCPDLDNYGRGPPRWQEGLCQCRGCVLRRRERELLDDDNRTDWFAVPGLGVPLEGNANRMLWWIHPLGPRIKAVVRRGFVESITLTHDDFLRHAEALFRAAPIREVRLIDKDPQSLSSVCGWFDLFEREGYPVEPDDIDKRIWKLLQQQPHVQHMSMSHWVFYPDRAAGLDDLSRACVKYGRKKAHLPDLIESKGNK